MCVVGLRFARGLIWQWHFGGGLGVDLCWVTWVWCWFLARPIHQGIFWLLLADCLLLGWIGCQPVEAPFVNIGQISPLVFFLFFAITPILGRVGRVIPNSYTDETDHT
ncbi:Cytochrom_B_C domain-containing protein [Cephalotus follicularis]|uniref:Cytochrome b n=1 Tax=Cephalotus follicularis TaxID=3775 RepID=A0A1Q3BWV2_CEPFO|nr:Cytochrom_B_C domain-containing protein [Cephalotus follicularis]